MYTRFRTSSKTCLFAPGPMLRYSPTGPGASFLGMLGGAYERESDERVEKVIHEASLLLASLQGSKRHTEKFVSELQRLIAFLRDSDSESVILYSFEDVPTLEDLLAAETQGFGGDDWAMEEVHKRGEAIVPELGAVLADPKKHQYHLSVVRLLLFCFPGIESRKLIERFIESPGDTEEKKGAAMLLAVTPRT
jgi:hypothetical protein